MSRRRKRRGQTPTDEQRARAEINRQMKFERDFATFHSQQPARFRVIEAAIKAAIIMARIKNKVTV